MIRRLRRVPAVLALAAAISVLLPAVATAVVTPASTAPPGQRLALVLPLASDGAGLARFAQAVSTPGSPQYHHYESIASLARRFGASARARSRVIAYLRRHGARGVRIDATGLFAEATLSVAGAQQLFGTSLSARRAGHERFVVPVLPVTVPRGLRGIVTGVIGLDTRPSFSASATASGSTTPMAPSGYSGPDGTPQGCAAGLTPEGFAPNQYLDAYQYAPLHAAGTRGQGESVALVEIDGFNLADISTFASCFGLRLPAIDAHAVGIPRLLAPGGEATLDLEVLDAAAPRLKSIQVYETKPDAEDVLKALTAPLQGDGYKPGVISVSLGLCESDTDAAVGSSGIATTESALEEAAAAGISVLGASGDSGSAGCLGTSGDANAPLPELAVIYPASSPWVTAVGGTNLSLTAQNQIEGQTVWNDAAARPGLAGGGGFSTLFPRPSYQNGVVSESVRAVPDLALLADVSPGYDVYCTAQTDCGGKGWVTFGGTSAATPLLAGGFALIDQLLRERELQPLGLANPLIYALAQSPPGHNPVFDDVTQGSNDVGPFIQPSGQPLGCCSATSGFDEASGWGGIDLAVFAQDAEAAQPPSGRLSLRLRGDRTPVAAGAVSTLVRCTRNCDLTVRVKVTIPRQPAFTDYSRLTVLKARARTTVRIAFTRAQLTRMRSALRRRLPILASLTAALSDASGNIERQTPTLRLKLRG